MTNYEYVVLAELITCDEEDVQRALHLLNENMFEDKATRAFFSAIKGGMRGAETIIKYLSDAFPDIESVVREALLTRGEQARVPLKESIIIMRNRYIAKKYKEYVELTDINEFNAERALRKLTTDLAMLVPIEVKNREQGNNLFSKYKDSCFTDKVERFYLGIDAIDILLNGIDRGDVCIIAARPSVGKSALALQIMRNKKDKKCGYFNLEMNEEQIFQRLIAAESGIELNRIRNAKAFLGDEKERYEEGGKRMASYNFDVLSGRTFKVSEIRNIAKNEKYDYVVIDYLQIISPERGDSMVEKITDISHELKNMAIDLQIPVIALSQLNRTSAFDKEPFMNEIRDSGAIEQDASEIIMLWGDKVKGLRNAKVEKSRNGGIGSFKFLFDGAHMTFKEMTDKEYQREKPKENKDDIFVKVSEYDDIPFT